MKGRKESKCRGHGAAKDRSQSPDGKLENNEKHGNQDKVDIQH